MNTIEFCADRRVPAGGGAMQPLELTEAGEVVGCATELETVFAVYRAAYNAYHVTKVATRALGFTLSGETNPIAAGSGSRSSDDLLAVRIGGLG
jgi:hypothetical protein